MIGDIPDPQSALYKTWVMLLNGYGYNWYRKDNQLRADDLLVRERAGHFIVEAAKAVQIVGYAGGRLRDHNGL